jgi:hypothetical protein
VAVNDRKIIPIQLSNGESILVEATLTAPEGVDEGFGAPKIPSMKDIAAATESIGTDLLSALQKLEPSKGSIELGFQVSGSAGIPLLTQGTAQANVKVTLEWDTQSASATATGGARS